NEARTNDGIGHAAAGLAHRRWNFGEEVEIQRTCAHVDEIEEDREQRNDHDDGRQNRQAADEVVRRIAERIVQAHGLALKVHGTGLVVEGLSAHANAPAPERYALPPKP